MSVNLDEAMAFDVETTGLDPEKDRVIELAVVYGNGVRHSALFSAKVSPEIERLTGITQAALDEKGVPFAAVAQRVAERFAEHERLGRVFVAHNMDFDRRFLDAEMKRCGLPPLTMTSTIDTCIEAQYLWPERTAKLVDVAEGFKLQCVGAHRATADAWTTLEVAKAMHASGLSAFGPEHDERRAWVEEQRRAWGRHIYADRTTGTMRCKLGKHRGLPLAEVPADYLRWMLGHDDMLPAAREVIRMAADVRT